MSSLTIIVGIVGFVAGQMVTWATAKKRGHTIVYPFVSGTSRNFTIMAVVFAMLSIYSLVSVERSNSRDEARARDTQVCFQQFAEAITYNTNEIAVAIRDKDNEAEALRTESRMATNDLIESIGVAIVAIPAPTAEQLGALFDPFNETNARVDRRLDEIAQEKAELNAQRAAYPTPTCTD